MNTPTNVIYVDFASIYKEEQEKLEYVENDNYSYRRNPKKNKKSTKKK